MVYLRVSVTALRTVVHAMYAILNIRFLYFAKLSNKYYTSNHAQTSLGEWAPLGVR